MDRSLQAQIETDPVLQRAVEWLLELRCGTLSGERIDQWQQWLAETAHRQAFDRVESLWRMTASVTVHWPSKAELANDGYAGQEGILAWRGRCQSDVAVRGKRRWLAQALQIPRAWRRSGARLSALAACAAAAIIAGVTYWPAISVFFQGGTRIFAHTGIGETRTLTLRDGTTITLGGDTTLIATLLAHSRTMTLKSGEAYFRVKRDPGRPFAVRVGRSTITDVGTTFDVRHVDNGIVVSVAAGEVRVTTPTPRTAPPARSEPSRPRIHLLTISLTAGQRLALEPFDTVPRIFSIDPNWAAGWLQGRLHYLDEPLGSVVADLNRYSNWRIIVADPDAARLRVTAVVSVYDIRAWLASLSDTLPVRVVRHADSEVIEQRQAPEPP